MQNAILWIGLITITYGLAANHIFFPFFSHFWKVLFVGEAVQIFQSQVHEHQRLPTTLTGAGGSHALLPAFAVTAYACHCPILQLYPTSYSPSLPPHFLLLLRFQVEVRPVPFWPDADRASEAAYLPATRV